MVNVNFARLCSIAFAHSWCPKHNPNTYLAMVQLAADGSNHQVLPLLMSIGQAFVKSFCKSNADNEFDAAMAEFLF